MVCNFQSFKQLSAVLTDIEKAFQHIHTQGLTKSPWTGNQCNFRFLIQKFRNQAWFIDIVKTTVSDFFKVRNSNRNIHFFHLCRSFPVAMHRSFFMFMITWIPYSYNQNSICRAVPEIKKKPVIPFISPRFEYKRKTGFLIFTLWISVLYRLFQIKKLFLSRLKRTVNLPLRVLFRQIVSLII